MKITVVLGMLLVALPISAGTVKGDFEDGDIPFGVNIHIYREVTSELADKLEDLGVGYVRLWFMWPQMEPTPGDFTWCIEYKKPGYTCVGSWDEGIENLRNKNIQILAVLNGMPWRWCQLPGNSVCLTPQNTPTYFSRFAKETVQRYKPGGILAQEKGWGDSYGIKYWEIWNEPDLEWPKEWPPVSYVRLLNEAYRSIKGADPNAKVLSGGMSINPTSENCRKILKFLYDNGAKFDIMNFHYYPYIPEPPWEDARLYRDSERGIKNRIEVIREVMRLYGDLDKPIWNTEGAWGIYGEESNQSRYIIRYFVDQIAERVLPVFWFVLLDIDQPGAADWGLMTGKITDGSAVLTPKLGYYTYKLMIDKLKGSDWDNVQTVMEDESEQVYAYKFMKNGKPIYVLWWDYWEKPDYKEGDTKMVTLENAEGSELLITNAVPKAERGIDVVDFKTAFETRSATVTDAKVSIELGQDPVFLEPIRLLDTMAPAKITDLAASDPKAHSITLTWTAPGDDGNVGTATSYDIRYFTSPITEGNWVETIQRIGEPIPKPAGSKETFIVTGLQPETTYYFAIKAQDEAGNTSEISNIAVLNTTLGIDLSVEGIEFDPQYITIGQTVTLRPLITNIGTEASIENTTKGKFYSNGEEVSVIEIPWSIPPEKTLRDVGERVAHWTPPDVGTYEMEFILETQDDVNPGNNSFKTTVEVHPGILGDINNDGKVDIFDLVIVAKHFGEKPPKEKKADVNGDGIVDIFDLVIVARHFGEKIVSATTTFAEIALG